MKERKEEIEKRAMRGEHRVTPIFLRFLRFIEYFHKLPVPLDVSRFESSGCTLEFDGRDGCRDGIGSRNR